MNKTYLGYLLVTLSALAFASMSLFTKMAYAAGLTPWSFSLIQSSLALIMLGALLVREPKPAIPRPKAPLRTLIGYLLCGATAAVTFNVALVHLSMSLATILLFTYPAFTAIGAWALLGQRPTWLHGGALFLTLAGAVLTANLAEVRSGTVSLLGVVLAVSSALAHGTYMVFGERIARSFSATAATALTRAAILCGAVILSPSVFADLKNVPARGWLICLVTAIVSGVVPFLFLNRGIALIGANRAAIVSVVELPFAMGLGLVLQGDVIGPSQWVGAILIIAAVLVSQREHAQEEASADGSGAGTTGSV
jgi:drug/metabolite transporter (DMT)-like permease